MRILRAILRAREGIPVPQSDFETMVLRAMLDGGLPHPVLQHEVRCGDRRYFIDFAYPAIKLGIEAYGRTYHEDPRDWERDRARENDLRAAGFRLHIVTWRQFERDPGAVVAAIKQAFADLSKGVASTSTPS